MSDPLRKNIAPQIEAMGHADETLAFFWLYPPPHALIGENCRKLSPPSAVATQVAQIRVIIIVHMTPFTGVTLPVRHVDVDKCVRIREGRAVVDASFIFAVIRQRSTFPVSELRRGCRVYLTYQKYPTYLTTRFVLGRVTP
jgi:hypothetical protein